MFFSSWAAMARPEAYSDSSWVSDMELFAKVVNGSKPLTTFAETSFLDVWLGAGYTGFFVHPWCDKVPGFTSPNKLLQNVNNFFKEILDYEGNLFANEESE